MLANINVGSIKPVELPKLASMYCRAIDNLKVAEHWTNETALKLLEYWFDRQPDLAVSASLDDELVGGLIVGIKPWWDGNHIVDGELFVDPRYQNKGIARAMLREVIARAIEKYQPLTWETYTFKQEEFPLSWYQRIGFEPTEDWIMIRANITDLVSTLQIGNSR